MVVCCRASVSRRRSGERCGRFPRVDRDRCAGCCGRDCVCRCVHGLTETRVDRHASGRGRVAADADRLGSAADATWRCSRMRAPVRAVPTVAGASGVYMTIGPTRVGRPLSLGGLVGQVCFGDCGCVPDDAAHVGVAVVGFDVADRIALGGECCVVVVCVDVRGDEFRSRGASCRCSLSASARLLIGSGNAGLRGGSTSTQRGPEPRAATRRPFGAEHGEHGEDRNVVAALLRAAPKAGLNRRDLARH